MRWERVAGLPLASGGYSPLLGEALKRVAVLPQASDGAGATARWSWINAYLSHFRGNFIIIETIELSALTR